VTQGERIVEDVIIVGGGLAGLTLARQLLLYTERRVLVLDRREEPAQRSQKVGESLVQLSGYYMSRVLDLEEHLLREHYLKYNLRFYWKTPGRHNPAIEDYSCSYPRLLSNIATFQLDRNLLESHLLAANRSHPRFAFVGGVRDVAVDLAAGDEPHRVSFGGDTRLARWVVDASGRGSVLKRRLSLAQDSPIRHGASWCWVDGLVNIEKLTDRTPSDIRIDRRRQTLGNFPAFLATNHFCGEGCWFWVIPLHGKTSLGLVYDRTTVPEREVAPAKKLIEYVCREWPLFARDLPHRTVLNEGRFLDYAFGATQSISADRWALTGEAGRFTDPLYSPGSDLIAIYNTLIVDAIQTDDRAALARKVPLFEALMRAVYQAYVPSYAVSYDCLGDQEAFTLKYAWELAVYFGFYVMPFANDLFTNEQFLPVFLAQFARLGRINESVQRVLSGYFQWKKQRPARSAEPQHIEFYDVGCLRAAERLFYKIGVTPEEASAALDEHLAALQEFARYIHAHVHAVVVGDRGALTHEPFVSGLRLQQAHFDEAAMRAAYAARAASDAVYPWKLDPWVLAAFLPPAAMAATEVST
jgi:flavin-dependent dehydrogenase